MSDLNRQKETQANDITWRDSFHPHPNPHLNLLIWQMNTLVSTPPLIPLRKQAAFIIDQHRKLFPASMIAQDNRTVLEIRAANVEEAKNNAPRTPPAFLPTRPTILADYTLGPNREGVEEVRNYFYRSDGNQVRLYPLNEEPTTISLDDPLIAEQSRYRPTYPIAKFILPHNKGTLIIGAGDKRWGVSANLQQPLELDFMGLFDPKKKLDPARFHQGLRNWVYPSYAENKQQFSLFLNSEHEVFMFVQMLSYVLKLKEELTN